MIAAGIFHKGKAGLFGLPDHSLPPRSRDFFVGAILFSTFADRLGRRPIFTYSLLFYAATTVIMSSLSSSWSLCLWRFIASIGVGAEVVAVDAYLAELMPKRLRGRGFAISTALQFSAVPFAGLLAAVVAHRVAGPFAGWRVLLFFPALGALLIWFVRRTLPVAKMAGPTWEAG